MLNDMHGISFGIHAEDLCLYTTSRDKLTHSRLQFAIWMVQWHAAYLGLNLNQTKTFYQHFTRRTKRPHVFHFDCTMNDRILYGEGCCFSDIGECFAIVQRATQAIKYLCFILIHG